jgi:hypothetical protein
MFHGHKTTTLEPHLQQKVAGPVTPIAQLVMAGGKWTIWQRKNEHFRPHSVVTPMPFCYSLLLCASWFDMRPSLGYIGGALHSYLHSCRSFFVDKFVIEVLIRARLLIACKASFEGSKNKQQEYFI